MKHIEGDIAPTRRASPGDLLPAGGGKARIRQFLAFLPKALLAGLLILAILDMLAGVLLRYVVVAVTEYFDLPGVNFFWVEEVGEFARLADARRRRDRHPRADPFRARHPRSPVSGAHPAADHPHQLLADCRLRTAHRDPRLEARRYQFGAALPRARDQSRLALSLGGSRGRADRNVRRRNCAGPDQAQASDHRGPMNAARRDRD